ncbi:MAG: hypothetical protein BWX86_01839 [Verrucomicrobia bacterium ADurb.Bin122]|nr:MAG: hypothetical protein BWX86_01839 [Verrucomicrobia bacterium ADurb.Bin122]
MLHVKERHALVQRDLEPRGRRGAEERLELRDVEIVAGGDALEPVAVQEMIGGERVGDVEREVAAAAGVGKGAQVVVVAHEVAVGAGGAHELENPFLAGFEDARRSHPDRRAGGRAGGGRLGGLQGAETRDGVAVVFRVFEIAVERAGAGGPRGVELGEVAHEHDQLGLGGDRGGGRGAQIGTRVGLERPAAGRGAEFVQLGEGVAAQLVELADGQVEGAFEVRAEFAEVKRGAAEPAELRAQAGLIQRLFLRGDERRGAGDLHDVALAIVGDECERRAGVAVDFEGERARVADLFAGKGGADLAVERGVVGFPDAVADVQAAEIEVAAAEAQDGLGAVGLDLVNASALFAGLGRAGVEDQTVAGLERGGEREVDSVAGDAGDAAEEDAALGAEAAVGELLVVVATEPAGVEAARERHLELVAVARGRGGGRVGGGAGAVEGLAVHARDAGDVLRGFEAALDLERGDAEAHELGQQVDAGEVLRAEQVFAVAERDELPIAEELVRQAAGLGALAAVGGAAAERLAREALAGVGHAEGAVHEDLQRERRGGLGRLDGGEVGEGVFAGEHDELRAELAGKLHAGGAGDRHLRGGVDREIGRERADEAGDADVLHDGGIDSGGDDGAQVALGVGEFVGEDEGVEGDVAAHAALVEERHEPGQVGEREVVGAHAGVEALEAEVDGIGAVFDGGAHALPVAGGREQLRAARADCRRGRVGGCGSGGHGRARCRGAAVAAQVGRWKKRGGAARGLRGRALCR